MLRENRSRRARQSVEYRTFAIALGSRIRSLRLARALTLERASELMDLDLKHLQKIEAGHVNVTLLTLLKIALGLGEPLHEIIPHAQPTQPALFLFTHHNTSIEQIHAGSGGR